MKGYKKLLLIILIMSIILLINSFIQIFNLITYSLFLLFSFFIVKKLMGFEKDNFPDRKEIITILVISVFLFYAITYSAVFFWGILENRIVFTFSLLLNNIIPLFLIIILTELLRFIIIRKGRGYKSIWILAIILFTLIEVSIKMKGYDLNIGIDLLRFSIEVLSISIVKNILLCYLVNRTGYKATIIFRLIYEIPLYILPFFPNLGIFIDSVTKIIFPGILLFIFLFKYEIPNKYDIIKEKIKSKVGHKICYGIIVIIMGLLVALSSAKFNLFTIVVGSGSMRPVIQKGDLVLVKKVKPNTLKKDDILVFNHEGITVVHRIIEIKTQNGEPVFYTKGDANKNADDYGIDSENAIGKVIFKIKYIGYPTIWINDQIKE